MELSNWAMQVLILLSMFAVLVISAVTRELWKRVERLESRIADWDLWSDCVDHALDPATAHKIKTSYLERKRRAE